MLNKGCRDIWCSHLNSKLDKKSLVLFLQCSVEWVRLETGLRLERSSKDEQTDGRRWSLARLLARRGRIPRALFLPNVGTGESTSGHGAVCPDMPVAYQTVEYYSAWMLCLHMLSSVPKSLSYIYQLFDYKCNRLPRFSSSLIEPRNEIRKYVGGGEGDTRDPIAVGRGTVPRARCWETLWTILLLSWNLCFTTCVCSLSIEFQI